MTAQTGSAYDVTTVMDFMARHKLVHHGLSAHSVIVAVAAGISTGLTALGTPVNARGERRGPVQSRPHCTRQSYSRMDDNQFYSNIIFRAIQGGSHS